MTGGKGVIMEIQKTKVGIITIYYRSFNYGGLLQSYALTEFINKKTKLQAEQISYAAIPAKKTIFEKWDLIKGFSIKALLGKVLIKLDILWRIILKPNISKKFTKREQLCDSFRNMVPHSAEVKENDLKALNKKYDVFISGSDQVWNPNTFYSPYFLDFVTDNKKKIAFAASMGVNALSTHQEKKLLPLINRFDLISVREKKAKQILEKCIPGMEIKVVLDPVLLLDTSEWNQIAKTLIKDRKYIYAYFLGERQRNIRLAKKTAQILNLPIATVPYIYRRYNGFDHKFGDIRLYDAGPCEFLGLIKDAEFILTDSFHAAVFSVIFQKPFFVYDRDLENDTNSMNSRLIDFLEELGLEDRRITREKQLTESKAKELIDYQKVYSILQEKRKYTMDFLFHALDSLTEECEERK